MTRTTKIADLGIASAAATWVLITATNQHPNRSFDWARRHDPTVMLLPNWRFFAPNPAVHDFRIAHRYVSDGVESPWVDTHDIPARRWWNPLWFPSRRFDKAVTDLSNGLIEQLSRGNGSFENTVHYRVLASIVRQCLVEGISAGNPPPDGFQFAVGRDAGRDDSEEPTLIFTSRYEPWGAAA